MDNPVFTFDLLFAFGAAIVLYAFWCEVELANYKRILHTVENVSNPVSLRK